MIFILILVTLAFGLDKNSPPYTFTYGTPALPNQVNINFDSVDAKCDQLVDTVNGIRKNTILDTVYCDTCFISELVGDSCNVARGTFDSCFIQELELDTGTFDTTKTTKANADTLDSEQIRINYGASGGTPSTLADDIVIEGSGSTGLSIITPNDQYGRIVFASAFDDYLAYITWKKDDNLFKIGCNNGSGKLVLAAATGEALRVDSTKNIGIGTTSPAYKLDVSGSGNFDDSVVCDSSIANRVITNTLDSDTITADTTFTQKLEADTIKYNINSNNIPWQEYQDESEIKGWSSYSIKLIYYKKEGNMYYVEFNIEGTSDVDSIQFTMPVDTLASSIPYAPEGVSQSSCLAADNGSVLTTPARVAVNIKSGSSDSIIVRAHKSWATNKGWTASNTKQINGTVWYEVKPKN